MPPKILDWESNYWTDKDGNTRLSEQDILDTGVVRSLVSSGMRVGFSQAYNLDVVPFLTEPYVKPLPPQEPASARGHWVHYY